MLCMLTLRSWIITWNRILVRLQQTVTICVEICRQLNAVWLLFVLAKSFEEGHEAAVVYVAVYLQVMI